MYLYIHIYTYIYIRASGGLFKKSICNRPWAPPCMYISKTYTAFLQYRVASQRRHKQR